MTDLVWLVLIELAALGLVLRAMWRRDRQPSGETFSLGTSNTSSPLNTETAR